ncbi:DNA-directed RNA polymerase III subunit RPC1 [Dirofilaria immitis]|nr:DNA-directed RNA polymerase III subunit RPC1 [Dirofilaria immitis]
MGKEQYRESDLARKVSRVQFTAANAESMRQVAHISVFNSKLYDESPGRWIPVPHGPLDPRLGTCQKHTDCQTCKQNLVDCVGHFGYIDLAIPVFHVGFFRLTIQMLQCICKFCSAMLITGEQKKAFLHQVNNPNLDYLRRKALHKRIVAASKKITVCNRCGHRNVFRCCKKAVGAVLKIAHAEVIPADNYSEYIYAVQENKELQSLLPKTKFTLLDPLQVQVLFSKIEKEDIPLLMVRSADTPKHPSDVILTRIPVPPCCIRPSVVSEVKSGTTEDDITMKLSEIMLINDVIEKHKKKVQCALYINSELSGLPPDMQPKRATRGFTQRLKGKQGRFRGNLSGKRVDFSGRTVISPDPNLRIDQVGVPVHVAKILTFPEIVNAANIERMRKLILNGDDIHPGANHIVERATGNKRFLKYGNREITAAQLKVGDIIERHLDDNDIVLFNRQPSLHKISIMSHRAKIVPGRTFRFNECACAPYNADFDGDEMNLHVPQTYEARAEASLLMGVKQRIRIPPPAILKPVELWTGKQLVELIIRPDVDSKINLNLTTKNKSYTGNEEFCVKDSYVIIRNSVLICGVLDKALLGSGSKTNIFYILLRDFGEDAAVDAMWRLGRMAPVFLSNRGFSIGNAECFDILHYTSFAAEEKTELLRNGYKVCGEYIESLKEGRLKAQPGCTEYETLEALILKELSAIRDHAGQACLRNLSRHNAPLAMAVCGSKGSFINISQMIACVGQQAISGHRPPDGFEDRSLPHFERRQKTPAAKGFVENSFYSGLTPTEFFFHTMGGREGLVDTAVKLPKLDLCVNYDGTVRSSVGDVIEFTFGEDGLDPALMESKDGSVIDFKHVLEHIRSTVSHSIEEDADITSDEMQRVVTDTINEKIEKTSSMFREQLESFITEYLKKRTNITNFQKTASNMRIDGFMRYIITKISNCRIMRFFYIIFSTVRALACSETEIKSHCLSRAQAIAFIELCSKKFRRAMCEPGTAVGAIAATSIGEPSTQMTLKTFHFAGVASMNITQGVPRIKEIINGVKLISTPIITAALTNEKDENLARRVKARIEKTTLGEICDYIEEVYLPDDCFILLKINAKRVRLLQLEITMSSIAQSICTSKLPIPVKISQITILGKTIMTIRPPELAKCSKMMAIQYLKYNIGNVVVKGIYIPLDLLSQIQILFSPNGDSYKLLVEGIDYREVMATVGVDGRRTYFNNALTVADVLGIEAARSSIISEILSTMASHGIDLDQRHVMLLADLMTYRGEVLGITRNGLVKMKESVLLLASFEKTADHLFEAAFFHKKIRYAVGEEYTHRHKIPPEFDSASKYSTG